MPYCAPSENGTQCQTCSREPFARGSRVPAQPGMSSLVRRGASRGSFKRYLTLLMRTPQKRAQNLGGFVQATVPQIADQGTTEKGSAALADGNLTLVCRASI